MIHFSEMICLLGPTAGPGCKSTKLSSGCQLLLERLQVKSFFLLLRHSQLKGKILNAIKDGVYMYIYIYIYIKYNFFFFSESSGRLFYHL